MTAEPGLAETFLDQLFALLATRGQNRYDERVTPALEEFRDVVRAEMRPGVSEASRR
jgi:hypothetical protein